MAKWILITLAIGGYLGMWILTAWLLRILDDDFSDPDLRLRSEHSGPLCWPC